MIKFGPSGNSVSFYAAGNTTTTQMPKWINNLNLDCFEYSFGRGITISDEKCLEIAKEAKENNIEISVHAPYFINFASTEFEKIEKSVGYIINSIKKLQLFGGKRCVFHASSMGKLTREEAVFNTLKNIDILIEELDNQGIFDVILCPETMGKQAQIGTTQEIVEICKRDKRFYPCMDFGHINARTLGSLKTADDYKREIDLLYNGLNDEKASNMHVHFSNIEYGKSGEIRHLTNADMTFGPFFDELAKVLVEYKMTPYIISESAGTQAEDAVMLKNIYKGYLKI